MKKYFVLGSGIGYSLSPAIFANIFAIFGEKAEYSIVDLLPENLGEIVELAAHSDGFNVTKPFKREIIRYLASDNSGCGSVNTVTTRDMAGYSTDGDGFLFDLERNFAGASSGRMLVIGYGGAARAVVNALKAAGAEVAVAGRNAEKVDTFCDIMGVKRYDRDFRADGIVSCVTQTYLPPELDFRPRFCYDVRYAGETLRLDCPCSDGKGMLIAQAIYSYMIFTGKRFDRSDVESVYLKLKEIL